MTRHELWTAVLAATAEIDRLVAAAAGDLPDAPPLPATPTRTTVPQLETTWRVPARPDPGEPSRALRPEGLDGRERERLAGLREAVRRRLEALWAVLDGAAGFDGVRRALVIHVDERTMRRLPEYLRLGWQLLQVDITRSTTGGVDFFTAIDAALHDPRTPSLVFEVHLYCLTHGFVGKFATDPAQLGAYKSRLAERIPHPIAPISNDRTDPGQLPAPWPLWCYYSLGLVGVVLIAWLLTALSNDPMKA